MKLSRAYVTKCGKLIGLITLEDLRLAVENVKNGKLLETEQETCEQRASLAHKEAEENLNNDVLTPKLEVIRGKTGAKKLSRDLSKISRVENLL
uniref:CBS domain-containing protein n=1 Tax=Ditylenchus dipsaci TaxID=166011 RepID=A0A915D3M9_9BILA